MIKRFPEKDKRLVQNNRSDILGTVAHTFNIDLNDNIGRIKVAPRLIKILETGAGTKFTGGVAVNFTITPASAKFTATNARVYFGSSLPNTAFTMDTATGSPTDCHDDFSDIVGLNNKIYVSTTDELVAFNLSAWSSISSLTANTPHVMCLFGGNLYVKNNTNTIGKMTAAEVFTASALTIGTAETILITFIKAGSDRIWIGTAPHQGIAGGQNYTERGKVYEWDGASLQPTRFYEIDSVAAISCVIKDDVPYIVDSNARLLKFNGGGFTEIARFPTNGLLLKNYTSDKNDRFIHPNGMTVMGDEILMLVNNETVAGTRLENFPAGIWAYNERNGLYHKYAFTYNLSGDTEVLDYGQVNVARVGALVAFPSNIGTANNGTLQASANIYTGSGATVANKVFYDDVQDFRNKRGTITTTYLESDLIDEIFQKVYVKNKTLNANSKITVKYRTDTATPLLADITWTDVNTFTTTTNISSAVVGDEIEVLQGNGGGWSAHITSISEVSGTYTVVLDDSFTGMTSTAKIRITKFKKVGEVTTGKLNEFPIMTNDSKIQLKVNMLFTGDDELEELLLTGARRQN
jgi:hypothetical protein